MSHTINVQILDRGCAAGDSYAAKHATGEPKAAVVSCEGACIKGEVARRAANVITHELAPERAVRICHGGGFLLTQGGMRELVEQAEQVVVVDGCSLVCGTRLAKAAFPEKELDTVVANSFYVGDEALFGVNELADEEINAKARQVAKQILAKHLTEGEPCGETTFPVACGACP
ncbi:MAG TPA: putative zinc-binding protein [Deferrisomatales bacterium]|nr:putative zinc-binding protein [Deferrisomatales bacterium]